ncbi:hypothetical protein ES702_02632 [subsurface metagenome]
MQRLTILILEPIDIKITSLLEVCSLAKGCLSPNEMFTEMTTTHHLSEDGLGYMMY